MSATAQELSIVLRVEIAFVVTKFGKLPEKERERILGNLRSDDKDVRTQAARELGDILCYANNDELTRFINDNLAGGQEVFDAYLPCIAGDDYNNKCWMVGMYFYEKLPQSGTAIPLPSLE